MNTFNARVWAERFRAVNEEWRQHLVMGCAPSIAVRCMSELLILHAELFAQLCTVTLEDRDYFYRPQLVVAILAVQQACALSEVEGGVP